jgi:hypothetical protein
MQHQSGELTVIGTDQITIKLHGIPKKVDVHFDDEDDAPIPCNPHHPDTLEYEVVIPDDKHKHKKHHKHNKQFPQLIIKWHVNSLREIVWHVCY